MSDAEKYDEAVKSLEELGFVGPFTALTSISSIGPVVFVIDANNGKMASYLGLPPEGVKSEPWAVKAAREGWN